MNEIIKQIAELKKEIAELKGQTYQQDIAPKQVKQRHVDGLIVFRGIAADRPDGSTEKQVYFATDTNTLSIFNGTSWVQEVLS